MATDPPEARRSIPASGPDDPTSDLVAQVHHHCRAVIEAELRRLARRNPSLGPDGLKLIDAALDDLVESLLLARLRSLPQHTVRLKRLFDTAREDS
jgi:hypothetical protein